MKKIEITKIKDCKGLIGETPKKTDYTMLIKEPTIFTVNNKTVAIYDRLNSKHNATAKQVALSTKVNKTRRQGSGVPTQSSVFGAVPKNGVRNYKCSGAQRNITEKLNFLKITHLAEILAEQYKKFMPENYKEDVNTISSSIEKDYLFKGLPFSTFNANVNQLIRYHTDSGNVKGVMSNVLISRSGVSGGELVFPEYGFALAQEDGFYSVFNGQKEVHGVAECKFVAKNAYRCSFVFYTLDQMKNCNTYKHEMKNESTALTQKNNNRVETFGMTSNEFVRWVSDKHKNK